MPFNRNAYVKSAFVSSALMLSALPASALAGGNGVLTDKSGNSYGIAASGAPNDGAGVENAALGNVVRYADAMAALAKGKQNGRHGMAIRLQRHPGQPKCTQTLRGTDQNNLLDGSASGCDETIYGLGGDDVIVGGSGNNTIDGGRGADTITGGSGANRFVYERAADSTLPAADTITDFKSNDTIDLAGLARTAGVRLTFIGWSQFSGVPGQVNYSIMEYWKCDQGWHCSDQYVTIVGVDLTGSGAPDFCIDLLGRHYLTSLNLALGPAAEA